jgi:CRP/FNR family cyclic AMP-dependent transcriptional regulator
MGSGGPNAHPWNADTMNVRLTHRHPLVGYRPVYERETIMHRTHIVDDLERVPLFASCSDRQLAGVRRLTTKVSVSEGQPLVRQGMPSRQFLIITSGSVDITREIDSDVVVLATCGAGEFVGESGLLSSSVRTVSVVASSECEVLVATRHEFLAIMAELPIVATKIRATAVARAGRAMAV